ncbi:unnamed protein product [Trifolium pratense]|uniref:Uncharacterized protein n=1 Tax=Trifolium pratense TaxID=57577 RepID=A0ACB0J327_TRIPR|nr:unnamed protein product [Trifolium pratense]
MVNFISARVRVACPWLEVHEGEAHALWHAIVWIGSMGLHNVQFETHCGGCNLLLHDICIRESGPCRVILRFKINTLKKRFNNIII